MKREGEGEEREDRRTLPFSTITFACSMGSPWKKALRIACVPSAYRLFEEEEGRKES